jgi:MoaA/NifB/PqqE/SkfB family radical SAM enzyme
MTTSAQGPDSYGLRPQAVEFPMMLVLSLVYPCNARCPHCPYTNSNIRKEYKDAPYMSEAIFKTIADEAGRYGAYLRISGGGEPMLHRQATDLFVYAKNAGCRVGLITNGSKFTPESCRRLIEAGIDAIEFSVDACTTETYEAVRIGLDWETLVANVRAMLALRNQLGGSSRIICSAVQQKGIDMDAVEAFWVGEIGVDALIRRKFLTWGVNTVLDNTRSADPSAYLDTETVPCPFIFERLNIDSRGNVMVCGYDISGNTNLGNVTTETLRDIWHGPGFQYYRERHLAGRGREIGLCSGCPDWQYRSWQHNYWKVLDTAERARAETLRQLGPHDDPGVITQGTPP